MTLLQQIQSEAVDGTSDLGSLLRRCRILAQRIGVEEFKKWVVYELEGYPADSKLPEYRVVDTSLALGTFMGHFGRRLENAQIPVTSIPKKMRDFLLKLRLHQGVGSIHEMVPNSESAIRIPWPVEAVRLIGQGDVYDGFYLVQAVRVVSAPSFHEVLNQVRNRILSFALELESFNPMAGEPVESIQSNAKKHMRNIFNTVIKGNVHNLAQASESFSQQAISEVAKGDFEVLRDTLVRAGLSDEDVSSLRQAVEADKRRGKETMGDKVKSWLGNALLKVSNSGVSAASDVAASVITNSLKAYFGV